MVLKPVEIVNGIFCIIVVIISFIIGLSILSKYKLFKQKNLILVGYTIIGIFAAWWAPLVSFIIAIFNNVGLMPPYQPIYLFIVGFLSATFITTWIIAIVDLLEIKERYKKPIIIFFMIESSIIEIIWLTLAIIEPDLDAVLIGPVDSVFGTFGKIYAANLLGTYLITQLLISIKSMRSKIPEVRLKGVFLLIGGMLLVTSAFFDSVMSLDIIGLTITRLGLILSILLLYCGFLLPEAIKKRFL